MGSEFSKDDYAEYIKKHPGFPLWYNRWWLDAVCGEQGWDYRCVRKNGAIVAALPFACKRDRLGHTILGIPRLTQTLGPVISYPPGQKYANRLGYEKSVMTQLIQHLPRFSRFFSNFHYSLTNWLPFYWAGFTQTTVYTYMLHDLSAPERVFASFRENIKTDIRKAEKQLTVEESTNWDEFYSLNTKTFGRQHRRVPYSYSIGKKLDAECARRQCRHILKAVDTNGAVHAAAYFVSDNHYTHYLLGGADPSLRSSGASSLLLWEAIRAASRAGRSFHFEGSMVAEIERFFRAFGAIQTPYHHVSKTNSPLLKTLTFLRQVRSGTCLR